MPKAKKNTASKMGDAPKGYHWMKTNTSYKLMKDTQVQGSQEIGKHHATHHKIQSKE